MLIRHRMQAALLARATALTLACAAVAACAGPSQTPSATPVLPDTRTITAWIAEIEAQGIRRPGWAADDWTEQWAAAKFREWGLQDVLLDPIAVERHEEQHWSLTVWPVGAPEHAMEIPSWPIPLSANADHLEGELVLSPTLDDVKPGSIAVVEYPLMVMDQKTLRDDVARWHHDPDHEFETLQQDLPMGERFQKVMDPEIAAGAIGYIGILDFPWDDNRYYVPYDAKPRSAPGLYLSRSAGDRLLAMMRAGPVHAHIEHHSERRQATSHNVLAALPGRSDEWIMIGSHHDGPWHSAVEDASGVALVMAQARYWAQVPESQRPHNLLFLLNGGHMSGGAGLHHMVDSRREFLQSDVVAAIHLEHAALEATVVDGRLVPTDKPEPRWWFTSYIPQLEDIVATAVCKQDLRRSLMMPPYGWPRPQAKHPPTDAAYFFSTTPVVSLLAAPMYLFDPADRMNMVDVQALEPISRAVIDMVVALDGVSAAELRAAEYLPDSEDRRPPDAQDCGA